MSATQRRDLIASAVTFLRDPTVRDADHAKKVSFLESKGLSSAEIQAALTEAETLGPAAPPATAPVAAAYNYAPAAVQPPPVPERDWRDWFIMAVVSTGFSYAVYSLGKRYILPLVKPPTPEALKQDKADLDARMDEAHDLLQQLSRDSESLKAQQGEQSDRVSTALAQLEEVVSQLRQNEARRDTDLRRATKDVENMRLDHLPRALEGYKERQNKILQDVQDELRSLKTLIASRQPATVGPVEETRPHPGDASPAVASSTTATNSVTAAAPASTTPPLGAAARNRPSILTRGGDDGIPAWQKAASTTPDDQTA